MNNEELNDLYEQIHNLERNIHDLETAIAYLINIAYRDIEIDHDLRAMEDPENVFSSKSKHDERIGNYNKMIEDMGGPRKVVDAFLNPSSKKDNQ